MRSFSLRNTRFYNKSKFFILTHNIIITIKISNSGFLYYIEFYKIYFYYKYKVSNSQVFISGLQLCFFINLRFRRLEFFILIVNYNNI